MENIITGYGTNDFWEEAEIVKKWDDHCRLEYNPKINHECHWRICEHGITIYFKTEADAYNYAISHGYYRKEELK